MFDSGAWDSIIGGLLIQIVVLAFIAGAGTAIGAWALWHYVLSHISIGWA
jgi:hypothetical protein